MYDWKNPLYQSASAAMESMDLSSFRRIAEYFRLLGDYKDSAARMEKCLAFPLNYFDTLAESLRSARSQADLDHAVRERDKLKELIGEKAFQGEPWQSKDLAFQKRLDKTQWRVFRIEHPKIVLLGGFTAFIVIFYLVSSIYSAIRPGYLVSKGDRASRNGNYIAAVSFYEEAEEAGGHNYRKNEAFQEKLNDARILAGREAMEKEAYFSALGYFEKAEDEALIMEASLAYAGQLLEQGNYSSAVSYLEKAGNSEKADDLRHTLISLFTEKEDYSQAISLLRQFDDTETVLKDLQDLCHKRAEKQVTAALDLETQDPEAVRKLGSVIDDVDGQLFFTKAVVNAGYDPYKVYPGGVTVKDLMPDYDFSKASGDAMPDTSKVLAVFLTEEPAQTYPTYLLSGITSLQDGSETVTKTVRLFPSISYSLKSRFRAETLSECTAYLLMHAYYMPSEKVEGVYHSKSEPGKTEDFHAKYNTLERIDEIFLCDRNDPEVIRLIGRKTNPAPLLTVSTAPGSPSPVFEYTTSDLMKPASELIGQPDDEWILSVVKEAVALINSQEE